MQLAEKEIIDIEQPVKTYWPDFPYPADVTIRHLMSHTAGIPNPIPLDWIHLASEHRSFDRNGFFKAIVDKNNKVKSKPNEKFAYSNLGYVLAGAVD